MATEPDPEIGNLTSTDEEPQQTVAQILSPASPKPLHFLPSSPSTIPVLQNQDDPVRNTASNQSKAADEIKTTQVQIVDHDFHDVNGPQTAQASAADAAASTPVTVVSPENDQSAGQTSSFPGMTEHVEASNVPPSGPSNISVPAALSEGGNIQALLDNLITSATIVTNPSGATVVDPVPAGEVHLSESSSAAVNASDPIGLDQQLSESENAAQIASKHDALVPATPADGDASAAGDGVVPAGKMLDASLPGSTVIDSLQASLLVPKDIQPHTQSTELSAHANQEQNQSSDEAYQQFLQDEEKYVAEGTWDRFPQGSRMFVGNLFTEKVSKRGIWDVFSKYGRMAQISVKNAYGFVQYIDPHSSQLALQHEEGNELGGRRIHLEISKPQRNTKNPSGGGRGGNRRSRSPDRPDRSRNAHRRSRDDYRPGRSPVRAGRGADTYDGYYGRRRSRSRSPYGRGSRYRSSSPHRRDHDDESRLPFARRSSMQVPEVQIVLIDDVDRTFIAYIQQVFRDKGLRCDVLHLPRGVLLQAVIKRQIVEGVQAIVKIHQRSQMTGKIPLQVFDRSAGTHNVRFDEYEELDAQVAADVVLRAKYQQQQYSSRYPPNDNYSSSSSAGQHSEHGMPPQAAIQQHLGGGANTNLATALSSLDGASLQKLVATLSQNPAAAGALAQPAYPSPQQATAAAAQQQPQDLTAILAAVAQQTAGQQQTSFPAPAATFPPPAAGANASLANGAAMLSRLFAAQGRAQAQGTPSGQTVQGQGQSVQDIMAQLVNYRS